MKAVQNQNQKTRTTHRGSNRGSALLLAVGLLTILAMLGTTFLIISRMDRQRSKAITAKATVDNLAAGVVSLVAAQLQADGGGGGGGDPKGNNGEDDSNDDVLFWRGFVDYASDDDGMDKFLWYDNYEDGADLKVRHYSNVLDNTTGTPTKVDGNTKIDNAKWVSASVSNSYGQKFKVAIQIIDTSSLINVNTACYNDGATSPDMPPYGSPVGIDLRGFIGATIYDKNNAGYPPGPKIARCGGQTDSADLTPKKINENIALHPDPDPDEENPYTPFSIGDEIYLRWLGDNNSRTETGTLYDSIGDSENKPILETFDDTVATYLRGTPKRQLLTTHSATRIRSRSGGKLDMTDVGFANDIPEDELEEGEKKEKDKKQLLYEELLRAAYPLQEEGEIQVGEKTSTVFTTTATQPQKLKMAHFVANLWAYGSPSDQNRAFAFTPDKFFIYVPELGKADTPELVSEGFTVYGVVAQPVIAEAYAYSLAQDYKDDGAGGVTGEGDNGWAYAIELYNPTEQSIILSYDDEGTSNPNDDHGYRLVQGSNTFDFPKLPDGPDADSDEDDIVLAAGGRIVIYSFGGQIIKRSGTPPNDYPYGPIVEASPGIPERIIAIARAFGFTEQVLTPTFNGWLEWGGLTPLDLSQGEVELQRVVKEKEEEIANPQTAIILMDKINPTDIGYTVTDKVTNDNAAPAPGTIDEKANLGRRDDNSTRERAIVAEIHPSNLAPSPTPTPPTFAEHTLLENSNGLAATDIPGVREGFSLKFGRENIADLSNIYLYGPEKIGAATDNETLPQTLDAAKNRLDRGRPNYLGAVNVRPDDVSDDYPSCTYPDVPWATLFNDLFERIPADDSRIYGRININTATKEVLKRLPWPETVADQDVVPATVADYIIEYRERKSDYSNRAVAAGITNLRTRPRKKNDDGSTPEGGDDTPDKGSDCNGFLTAGEIAIPLAKYAENLMSAAGVTESDADYLVLRDSLYRAVSNVISVRSDTFVVNLKIELEGGGPSWYYTAFIDRSTGDDWPTILLNNLNYQESD